MPIATLKPYWQATDGSLRLYHGDALDVLPRIPAQTYQTVVTSPPYWRLRDYGSPNEIGSEGTPERYVMHLAEVFREVWNVLRDDGTVWLNLGDTYGPKYPYEGVGLTGIPWMVALELRRMGWILWMDVIWHKPDPMPESVTNRCTRAHEYVFLLSKRQRYFYDNEAIKEASKPEVYEDKLEILQDEPEGDNGHARYHEQAATPRYRNKRSVWRICKESYPGAHFAVFPKKLITPCILAGTSEYGACAECGAPYKRVIEKEALKRDRPNDYVKRKGEAGTGNSCANSVAGVSVKTLGWEATCACESEEVVPCRVLDPFAGSATTLDVALAHGRHADGIELSKAYLDANAIPRCTGALLSIPEKAHLAGKRAERFELGEEA